MAAFLKVAQTMSDLIRKIMLEVVDSTENKLFIHVHVSQPHFALSCLPKQCDILSKPLIFSLPSFALVSQFTVDQNCPKA